MDDLSRFVPSNLLHSQERMSHYRPGGFHPVALGDTFKSGRYKVHHKLGYGGFSTVWLAKDELHHRWVSLKVAAADNAESSRELNILQKLEEAGAKHIVKLLDSFVHQGPNGKHHCLVFELLGPTIDHVVSDYRQSDEHLDPDIILRVTRQLLEALATIHEAGYAHGDVSGANLAFTARGLEGLSAEELFEVTGAPVTEELVRVDGEALSPSMPKQLVERVDWAKWIDEDEEDVCLIDFGEAFVHGAEPAELAEPPGLQVPEKIFTGKFDNRVDLWRAGCTIYTLVFGTRPFQSFGGIDGVVAQMIHFVEDLPAEWQPEWERMRNSAGKELPDKWQGPPWLVDKFTKQVEEPSLKPLLPIIQGLMRFQPEKRISAAEALRMLDEAGMPDEPPQSVLTAGIEERGN